MGTENHNRIAELFLKARELEFDQRRDFLDEACQGDDQLRSEVASLLAYDRSTAGTRAPESAEDLAHPESQIGNYHILQKIGEGGMGEVYLAEQAEPRRKVALKIIKWGMDTREVVARFESERQALALMDHPNIARVFDAGATEQGRPYFVMEHIKGIPITEHCDRNRLTIKERLALFRQVCEGVQHAHQKAVIHRDIKPSNILVTILDDKTVPKIIDFGIAKATAQRLAERAVLTEAGQIVGTREYMSPEQAESTAQDVDTRTDVYSLGVLLYELLVGALPLDSREFRQASSDEIRRKILEEEPSMPSAQISALGDAAADSAKNRGTEPMSLARQLRGDLDWITMKALEKDRTRRYGSPNEFAADIGRHLKHEPVLASPPSATYRVAKFVKRHRVGVTIALAAFLLLVGFAARERIQANRIVQERDRAQLVSEFQADMLGELDPQQFGKALLVAQRERVVEAQRRRGATDDAVAAALTAFDEMMRGLNSTDVALTVIDGSILNRASQRIEERFADEPLIAARLRDTIGQTYRRLGLYEQAEPHARLAVETRRRELGDDHPYTLSSMSNLAELYRSQGRYDKAEPLHVETLRAKKRVLGDEHPDTLTSMNHLAELYRGQGRYDKAKSLHVETLGIRKRVLGHEHPDTLSSMGNLAGMHWIQGHYDEAEPLYLETIETSGRVLGEDHPDILESMHNLALLYATQGRHDEAEPLYLETLEAKKRVFGDDHPDSLISTHNLAFMYATQGRYDEAEPLYLETLETQKRVLGDDHPDSLRSMNNLAFMYKSQGRYDEAEPLYLEALETRRLVLGDDHPDSLRSMGNLGELYVALGRPGEAEAVLAEALAGVGRALPHDDVTTGVTTRKYGVCLTALGRYGEAQRSLLEAHEILTAALGTGHAQTQKVISNLVALYDAWGRPEQAAEWRARLPEKATR